MKPVILTLVVLTWATIVAAATPQFLTGPVVDPAGLLSAGVEAEVRKSAEAFRKASGRWLVMVALPDRSSVDLSAIENAAEAPWETAGARTPIGIVYVAIPSERAGTLIVVDLEWRRVAHRQWIPMFPQRLAEKYGDESFERRVVLSAAYLAKIFPDKIAFLMQPPDVIGKESIEAAEKIMIAVELFVYFIILFTLYRTIWPAHVKDEDDDEVSNELRRLIKERSIW